MSFHISIDGAWALEVDQVWPDGDAPENPTAQDVIERMRPWGLSGVINDWNLQPEVFVNGQNAELR